MVKGKIIKEKNFCSLRLESPNKFDKKSFRTILPNKNTQIIVGCPKGKYFAGKKRCDIGLRTQSIRKKINRDGSCPKIKMRGKL